MDPLVVGVLGADSESGRRRPTVFLVRRGRDHFGVIQSFSQPVVADVEQRRRRPRPVLPDHARLVPNFPAHGVLVPRAKWVWLLEAPRPE